MTTTTSAEIEKALDIATAAWESLPEVASEIDSWDLLDQLDFIVEWPLQEMRLDRLDRYASTGEMTPQQLSRFKQLQHLVAQNRPVIEALQNS